MFRHSRQQVIAWGDCDPAGIVFYPRYFDMFDLATAGLLEAASGQTRAELIARHGVVGWPMVDTRATFRAPTRFDDRVRIDSCIERLGRSSFDVSHALRRGDELCVECVETRIWAARSAAGRLQGVPIPDELRQVLSACPEQKSQP